MNKSTLINQKSIKINQYIVYIYIYVCIYICICLRLNPFGGPRCYWPLQRSQTLQLLLPGPRNAAATLPDAATAASKAAERSCNAPRRCNCCFRGHATLLQRSQTLQLLLLGPCNAPALLLDAATAASTQRCCNSPRYQVSIDAQPCY